MSQSQNILRLIALPVPLQPSEGVLESTVSSSTLLPDE